MIEANARKISTTMLERVNVLRRDLDRIAAAATLLARSGCTDDRRDDINGALNVVMEEMQNDVEAFFSAIVMPQAPADTYEEFFARNDA